MFNPLKQINIIKSKQVSTKNSQENSNQTKNTVVYSNQLKSDKVTLYHKEVDGPISANKSSKKSSEDSEYDWNHNDEVIIDENINLFQKGIA